MTFGIRGKLLLVSAGLIVAFAITGGLLVETVLRDILVQRELDELERAAHAALMVIDEVPAAGVSPALTRLATSLEAQISWFDERGRLRADSALGPAATAAATEIGQIPEVHAALAHGRGFATRHTREASSDIMYLALASRRSPEHGVARVARSLVVVDRAVSELRGLILASVLIGAFVAMLMVGLASHFASRSLMILVSRARNLAVRPSGGRLPVDNRDELAGLAGSFNHLADELDRAIATLSRERDRIEALLESLADAVLALDPKGHISLVNRAARALLGVDHVAPDTPLVELIRDPDLLALVERAQQGESASGELSWAGPPRRVIAASASPERTRGQCVIVLRDVTELRRLETMRRDFVANVSHELRTPVSVISANVETLSAGALHDPARAAEFLGAVERNAQRLSRLVSDLLDLSRIEAGIEDYERSRVPLERPIGHVIDLLESKATTKGIELEVEVEDDVCALADPRALEQALFNLVDNAIKYTPQGGRIGIEAKSDGEQVALEVWDTGPGVPENHRARLFERFYRVDPGRSREMGGTGLGLAIVKHIVEAMHGEVGMQPRPGGGSVFWIRLPTP